MTARETFEQMDPDFGRTARAGDGFGSISEQEYDQLVRDLEN